LLIHPSIISNSLKSKRLIIGGGSMKAKTSRISQSAKSRSVKYYEAQKCKKLEDYKDEKSDEDGSAAGFIVIDE
jgi:hypothetical protein